MSEVVVVTGASSDVRFRRAWRADRIDCARKSRLESAQREVRELGAEALVFPGDVADPEHVESAAAAVVREFGPIDVWVNNAMTTVVAPFAEITPAEYKRATEVTYLGLVYGTMAALRRMRPRNKGVAVHVGSTLAYRLIPCSRHIAGPNTRLSESLTHCGAS